MKKQFGTIHIPTHALASGLAGLMLVFLVLFPKGGIKAGGVPLTWGYALLLASLPFLTAVRLLVFPLRVRPRTLLVSAALAPLQILLLYTWWTYGAASPAMQASEAISFFVLPCAFLLVYPPFLSRLDGNSLSRQFRFCVLAAALFGIFLFLEYPLLHKLFEVPYLTVNAGDAGQIVATKHIVRGPFLKLISTYNNGNLYGAATLCVLPLYNRLEPRAWKRSAVKLALLLTLSRSVWFALVFEQLLSLPRLALLTAGTFPRFALGSTVRRVFFILLTGVAVVGALSLFSSNLGFLFAADLGGRANPLDSFRHATFLPEGMDVGFAEIVYMTALSVFGYAGLGSMLLWLVVSPILVLAGNPSAIASPVRSAAAKGLILYAAVAASDGALLLIPTMVFYWFTYMILLEGWPSARQVPGRVPRPRAQPAPALAPLHNL